MSELCADGGQHRSASHLHLAGAGRYALLQTELGWVGIRCSTSGVAATTLPQSCPLDAIRLLPLQAGDREVDAGDLGPAQTAVAACMSGQAVDAALALDFTGLTPFQQRVLTAVRAIPPGETRSYGWLAEAIGHPRAARAVGQAVARNPLPLLVPCHRVVAENGLGGFGSGTRGLATKRSLLRREGVSYGGVTLEQEQDLQPQIAWTRI